MNVFTGFRESGEGAGGSEDVKCHSALHGARTQQITAGFWSGLIQITCTNGHLKPDFCFQLPGGGERKRGSFEVQGMRGRPAGRRGLKNNGQNKN